MQYVGVYARTQGTSKWCSRTWQNLGGRSLVTEDARSEQTAHNGTVGRGSLQQRCNVPLVLGVHTGVGVRSSMQDQQWTGPLPTLSESKIVLKQPRRAAPAYGGDLDMVEERDDRTVAESSLGPLVSRFVGHHSEKAWCAPRDLRVNPLSRCYLDRASCSSPVRVRWGFPQHCDEEIYGLRPGLICPGTQ